MTNENAPINSDTKAQLETQGLTGSATVALIGGVKSTAELTGVDGNPPRIPSLPTATLADLQTKAGYVLDLANKILVDNAQPIHQTIENVQQFSMALSSNSGGVEAALKGVADLGRTIEPLASRLQILSDDADKLVKAVNPDQVKSIVDNVEGLSGQANSLFDRVDKLVAANSDAITSTLSNVNGFSKTLSDNSANVDATLKGLADLGKSVQPLAARLQSLSDGADKLVKAIDPDKVRSVVDNVQSLVGASQQAHRRELVRGAIHSTLTGVSAFSKTLTDNSGNIDAALKGFGDFGKRIEPLGQRLQQASEDADKLIKSIDPDKLRGVVDNVQTFSHALAQSSTDYQTSDARRRVVGDAPQRCVETTWSRAC